LPPGKDIFQFSRGHVSALNQLSPWTPTPFAQKSCFVRDSLLA
jgi:hypothetical protein